MVTRRPGLMDETWTSFTSELLPTAWAGTMAFVILAPPCLVFCSRLSPSETEKVSFKDAYILAIGAFAIQGAKWGRVVSLRHTLITDATRAIPHTKQDTSFYSMKIRFFTHLE